MKKKKKNNRNRDLKFKQLNLLSVLQDKALWRQRLSQPRSKLCSKCLTHRALATCVDKGALGRAGCWQRSESEDCIPSWTSRVTFWMSCGRACAVNVLTCQVSHKNHKPLRCSLKRILKPSRYLGHNSSFTPISSGRGLRVAKIPWNMQFLLREQICCLYSHTLSGFTGWLWTTICWIWVRLCSTDAVAQTVL